MKLALIRHGTTAWNLEKRIQGRIDQPLCESGRLQLRNLKPPAAFADFRWYCSPLRRATQTAELLGLENARLTPALIEMSWGDWEGEILKPLRNKLGDEMRQNEARGLDFCPPGGESPRQLQARLLPWLHEVAVSGRDSGAITHKGVIRCLYALARGLDMRGKLPLDFSWNTAHLFDLTADGELMDKYQSIPLAGV